MSSHENISFCFIGPGYMSIPPKGWGACEILVWDYASILRKNGYNVTIVNESQPQRIIEEVRKVNATIIHIQYDDHAHLIPTLSPLCKFIFLTTHYAYLTQPNRWNGWDNIFRMVPYPLPSNCYILCLSEEIKDIYIKYRPVAKNKIIVIGNGARDDQFHYEEKAKFLQKSVCVGKVENRKRQYLLKDIDSVDIVGNIHDNVIFSNKECYKGEWDKETLFTNLTNYSNLILLSDGEADPLVVKEALIAGLGLVLSEKSTANLDLSKKFIDVIKETDIGNKEYITFIIEKNRKVSNELRKEIREYALENFSWNSIIMKKYIPFIHSLL